MKPFKYQKVKFETCIKGQYYCGNTGGKKPQDGKMRRGGREMNLVPTKMYMENNLKIEEKIISGQTLHLTVNI